MTPTQTGTADQGTPGTVSPVKTTTKKKANDKAGAPDLLSGHVAAAQARSKASAFGDLDALPKRLSPSRASDYMQCPKMFYYKTICGMREPGTEATLRGTLAHTAFERIFDHPAGARTADVAITYIRPAWEALVHPDLDALEEEDRERAAREAAEAAAIADPGTDAETAFLESVDAVVRSWFDMERVNNFSPAEITLPSGDVVDGREFHAVAEIAGMTLHGYIDRLDRYETADGQVRWSVSDYKGLAVDTPLPTPSGWTTMGDVQVGDRLIGADGTPTRVTVKSQVHNRPCYRIEFDDASSIVCDNVHLWQVKVGQVKKGKRLGRNRVVDADELYRLVHEYTGTRKVPVVVENAEPLVTPHVELPIDPYVLGVWLGDGATRGGSVYVDQADAEAMTALLTARGESVKDTSSESDRTRGVRVISLSNRPSLDLCPWGHTRTPAAQRKGMCRTCKHEGRPAGIRPAGLGDRLKQVGVRGDKHVPAVYLRASVAQRLDLLRGLMDTDGSWNKGRKQAVFTTTNLRLADAVQELVHSLGWRSSRFEQGYEAAAGSRTHVMVMFTPFGKNPFSLERKAALVRLDGTSRAVRRSVVSVVPVDSVPTQCVAVDAPDSLYLAGRQMVPTHNTGKAPLEGRKYSPFMEKKVLDDKFFQLEVYALLMWEMHRIPVHSLRLLYVKTGSRDEGILTRQVDLRMINRTRSRVESTWRQIERSAKSGQWKTQTGPLCNWCYFQSICPAFATVDTDVDGMVAEERAS